MREGCGGGGAAVVTRARLPRAGNHCYRDRRRLRRRLESSQSEIIPRRPRLAGHQMSELIIASSQTVATASAKLCQ